jgi:hypothetical protein
LNSSPSRRGPAVLLAGIALLASGCTGTSNPSNRAGARSLSPSTASPPQVATAPAPVPRMGLRVAFASEQRPFVSPIQPGNRPTVVAGDTNGMMPARDLVGVAPNCLAARAAAPSLGLLLATAREEGVVLHTEQCYRPLSDQVAVRQRWSKAGNSACAAPVVTTGGKPKGTSMHGWGKAADLSDAGGTVRFDSPGYRFLTSLAGRFGWNHPAWARPGGSVCPEAWHWEWVGDGGIAHNSPITADVVTLLPTLDGLGYSIVTGLGAVRPHGDSTDRGSVPSSRLAWLVAGAARAPDGGGYWLFGVDGSVYSFGGARFFGSTSSLPSAQAVVGMAPSANGAGYWLATASGQVYGFGAAGSYGSPAASGRSLARPVVAIAATPDGRGYWLASSDGKVFAYGDAASYGGASRRPLPAPVVSMTTTPDGHGYWLATADGSVYRFGDARSFGSIPRRIGLREPVVAIAATAHGGGYWLVAADGSVFAFGDSNLFGPAPRVRTMAPRRGVR